MLHINPIRINDTIIIQLLFAIEKRLHMIGWLITNKNVEYKQAFHFGIGILSIKNPLQKISSKKGLINANNSQSMKIQSNVNNDRFISKMGSGRMPANNVRIFQPFLPVDFWNIFLIALKPTVLTIIVKVMIQ